MGHLCYFCLVFLMLSRMFTAALWSPAGKKADLLAFVGDVFCIFVTFQCGILGQCYSILSFPDLCHLSYFVSQFLVFFSSGRFRQVLLYVLCIQLSSLFQVQM